MLYVTFLTIQLNCAYCLCFYVSSSSAVSRNEDDVFQMSVICPGVTQEPDS